MVEPRNGHLGGDTFMLIHLAAEGRVVALNGSGAAPAAATLDVYHDPGVIPDRCAQRCLRRAVPSGH